MQFHIHGTLPLPSSVTLRKLSKASFRPFHPTAREWIRNFWNGISGVMQVLSNHFNVARRANLLTEDSNIQTESPSKAPDEPLPSLFANKLALPSLFISIILSLPCMDGVDRQRYPSTGICNSTTCDVLAAIYLPILNFKLELPLSRGPSLSLVPRVVTSLERSPCSELDSEICL